MRKRTSTKITVETERLLFISGQRILFAFCEVCGDEVRFVTVEEAAAMMHLTSLDVYRSIEAGKLHHAETTTGMLLICKASIGDLCW